MGGDMIQTQIKFEGQVAPCAGCSRQPRAYNVRGKNLFFLECAGCGVRTAKHPAMQLALDDWEAGERVNFSVPVQRRA